jgi:hypothetical protein
VVRNPAVGFGTACIGSLVVHLSCGETGRRMLHCEAVGSVRTAERIRKNVGARNPKYLKKIAQSC